MQDKKIIRTNILSHSLDTGLFMVGTVCFHKMTIMVSFIKKLYDSPLIIGLLPAVLTIGFNLPGLITTHFAQRFRRRQKFIRVFGFIQRLSILFMALATFLLAPFGPITTLVLILIFYFSFSFSGGISSTAWMDFNAKTIPLKLRARTHSYRTLVGSAGGILIPLLIHYFLTSFEFPFNYQLCFFTGFGFMAISYIFFLRIKETNDSPAMARKPLKNYLASLKEILKADKNFVKFLFAQALLSISECGPAFFTYYAIKLLEIGDDTIVIYMFLLNLSMSTIGLLIGYIGDRFGNLKVIQIGAIISTTVLLLVVIWPGHMTFYIAFFLTGLSLTVRQNSFFVFVLEFGNDENRIRYAALSSALSTSLFGLMPFLGSILLWAKILDYTGLFILGAIFSLAALGMFIFSVKDPRFITSS